MSNCNQNTPCNECEEVTTACDCPVTDLSTDCSTYKGEDLPCSGISKNTILSKVIQDLDAFICNKFNEAVNYLTLTNIGTGIDVFKGINNVGNREFKRIQQGDYISITEDNDSIVFNNLQSSETQIGVIEIATQSETDAAVDDERAVTPAKLRQSIINFFTDGSTNITINPSQLPQATETAIGAAEIATQSEANSGTDDERIVTPLKMKQGVINILEDNSTNITIDPENIAQSTETNRGVIEIATQAEVNAGTDDERAITPAKLQGGVETIISNNNSGGGGLTFLPSGIITLWSGNVNSLPTDWYLCDGQTVNTTTTPNLSGQFVVGYDASDADYNTIGNTGGVKSNTLVEANIPEHNHDVTFIGSENSGTDPNAQKFETTDSNLNRLVTKTSTNWGSANPTPLENRPPYYTLAYIIYLP